MTLHERITEKGEIENYNWNTEKFYFGYMPEWKLRRRLFYSNRPEFRKFYRKKEKQEAQLKLF